MSKPLFHPVAASIELPQVLHALGDPVRLAITLQLKSGIQLSHSEFRPVGKHKATMTHHFRILREAGVTHTAVVGREHIVSLRIKDIEERFPGVLSAIWKVTQGWY